MDTKKYITAFMDIQSQSWNTMVSILISQIAMPAQDETRQEKKTTANEHWPRNCTRASQKAVSQYQIAVPHARRIQIFICVCSIHAFGPYVNLTVLGSMAARTRGAASAFGVVTSEPVLPQSCATSTERRTETTLWD